VIRKIRSNYSSGININCDRIRSSVLFRFEPTTLCSAADVLMISADARAGTEPKFRLAVNKGKARV
jgi:hypothetical protein